MRAQPVAVRVVVPFGGLTAWLLLILLLSILPR